MQKSRFIPTFIAWACAIVVGAVAMVSSPARAHAPDAEEIALGSLVDLATRLRHRASAATLTE